MYTYSFEKLEVWQKARQLCLQIYVITNEFPQSEKFGLNDQLRRCGISVISNLAEGSARSTPKDQAHFSTIAYGSLMELLCQLIIATDLKYIDQERLDSIRSDIDQIGLRITGLKKSQLARIVEKV